MTNDKKIMVPTVVDVNEIDPVAAVHTPYTHYMKAALGGPNAATIAILRDCMDQIRRHPRCQHQRKAWFLGKQNSVVSTINDYRRRLLHPSTGQARFFSVKDMPPEERKSYGDIRDEDLFDLWEGQGAEFYQQSRPLVLALHYKFQRIIDARHDPYPDLLAWLLVGNTVLHLACDLWRSEVLIVGMKEKRVPQSDIEAFYRPFSLQTVSKAWRRAVTNFISDGENAEFTDEEEHNVNLSIDQLRDLWNDMPLKMEAGIRATRDYDEDLYRTRGEAKKSIRQMAEMRQRVAEQMEQEKREKLDSGSPDGEKS